MRSYMVVCSISKMFHSAVERLLLAHALRQVVFLAKVGERLRCVRTALIAMKNQTFASLSLTAECFAKRSDCQVTRHMPIRQACNNAAVMQVNNRTWFFLRHFLALFAEFFAPFADACFRDTILCRQALVCASPFDMQRGNLLLEFWFIVFVTRIVSPFIRCFSLDIPVTTLVYHNKVTSRKFG